MNGIKTVDVKGLGCRHKKDLRDEHEDVLSKLGAWEGLSGVLIKGGNLG